MRWTDAEDKQFLKRFAAQTTVLLQNLLKIFNITRKVKSHCSDLRNSLWRNMNKYGYINSKSSFMNEYGESEVLITETVTSKFIMDGLSIGHTRRATFAGNI